MEGKRPNVIQFFSSSNGYGPASSLIMVRDLHQEMKGQLSEAELKALYTVAGSRKLAEEMFSEHSLREVAQNMGMSNVRNISSKRIVIEKWPAAVLEFIGEQQRLDFNLTMFNRMYMVVYKNYMVFLQCQISKQPEDSHEDFKKRIMAYDSLFQLMANSIVIQSQY